MNVTATNEPCMILETVELLEQGRWAAGGGYILASVGLCLAGVLLGRALVWKIL